MVRMKNRYFGIHVTYKYQKDQNKTLMSEDLIDAINDNIKALFGDFLVANVALHLRVKQCNKFLRTAILRCDRDHFDQVASTLPFVVKIGNIICKIRTIVVSGTIIHCQKVMNIHIFKIMGVEGKSTILERIEHNRRKH